MPRGLADSRDRHELSVATRARRPAPGGLASAALVTEMLSLQRTVGNRVATAQAPLIQAKLMVGSATDAAERQADEVAHQVMRQLRSGGAGEFDGIDSEGPALQRAVSAHGGLEAPIGLEGGEVSSQLAGSIQSERGRGHALPTTLRQPFEQAFGADLSAVRVHHDDRSSELNRAVSARAFTIGSDIFLGASQYQPSTTSGQELLAHELTHTIQQSR
jgi:Domain of unknown function (DUF4157)